MYELKEKMIMEVLKERITYVHPTGQTGKCLLCGIPTERVHHSRYPIYDDETNEVALVEICNECIAYGF